MPASPGPTRGQFACWLFALLPLAIAAPATEVAAASGSPRGVEAVPAAEVSVERDGGAYVLRAEAQLQADLRTAWLTVIDYEHLPQFVPGIRSVRVLSRVAQGRTERLLVEHAGGFRWLWFTQPVRIWLEVIHESPMLVRARSVRPSGVGNERSTLREFEGSYELEPLGATRTRLVQRARLEPEQPLLPVLGTLAVRQTTTEQFRALVAEIERRATLGRARQAAR